MAGKITIVCARCGGSNVTCDAIAEWDSDAQDWTLRTTLQNADCDDCGTETDLVERLEPDDAPTGATEPAAPIAAIIGAVSRSRMASSIGKASAKEMAAKEAGVRLVAIDIAATIGAQMPDFDRAAFLTACGFTD